MKKFLIQLQAAVPSIIYAIILLVIAFIVAGIARKLIVKLLKKIKADKYTDRLGVVDEETGSSLDFIGNLVYFVVFLLFLPAVLDKLGMQGVSSPITNFVSKFLNFIPSVIAAAIILAVGIFLARLIRQLVTPVLKRLKVDKLQEKAGVSSEETVMLSTVIAQVIYVLILIMVITAALQALNISAISEPAIAMLDMVFAAIPRLFVAIAIIVIGNSIAKMVGKLLESILSSVGADGLIHKITASDNDKLRDFSLSQFTGNFVRYIMLLFFIVEGFNFLNFEVLQSVGEGIISYIPYLVSAVLIMGIAFFVATWVEGLILKKFSNSKAMAIITKTLIIAIAIFMTLSQLGFARPIVNSAFIIILGSLAVAFAVSFGIGGRDFAANVLKKVEKKMDVVEE